MPAYYIGCQSEQHNQLYTIISGAKITNNPFTNKFFFAKINPNTYKPVKNNGQETMAICLCFFLLNHFAGQYALE